MKSNCGKSKSSLGNSILGKIERINLIDNDDNTIIKIENEKEKSLINDDWDTVIAEKSNMNLYSKNFKEIVEETVKNILNKDLYQKTNQIKEFGPLDSTVFSNKRNNSYNNLHLRENINSSINKNDNNNINNNNKLQFRNEERRVVGRDVNCPGQRLFIRGFGFRTDFCPNNFIEFIEEKICKGAVQFISFGRTNFGEFNGYLILTMRTTLAAEYLYALKDLTYKGNELSVKYAKDQKSSDKCISC